MALRKPAQTTQPARSSNYGFSGSSAAERTAGSARLSLTKTGIWEIRYTEHSETTRKQRSRTQTTGQRDRREAEAFMKHDWTQHILNGAAAKTSTPSVTFRQITDQYLATRDKTNRDLGDRALRLCKLYDWNDIPVEDLDINRFMQLRQTLETAILDRTGEPPSSGTVRQYMEAARAVLNRAKKFNQLPDSYTVPDLDHDVLPPVGAPRPYALSEAEADEVLQLAAAWSRDTKEWKRRVGLFACIGLTTGQRREAILELEWDRIDRTERVIDFKSKKPMPKNKQRGRAVPLRRSLAPILDDAARRAGHDQKGRPVGRVFTSATITTGFDQFKKELGLPDLTPHVFRHTFVTIWLARGKDYPTLEKITGDNIATLLRIYAHVRPSDHLEHSDKLEDELEARRLLRQSNTERTLEDVALAGIGASS